MAVALGYEVQGASRHPLHDALAAQTASSPEIRFEVGALEPGWTTAEDFIADGDAIEEFLAYEGSFNRGTDRKACAAFMMTDYASLLSLATVSVFVGSGLLPDCSTSRVALQFHQARQEHDGHVHAVRRAHVRYLSPSFFTERESDAGHPDARRHVDRAGLCELFRQSVEDHFRPLIETLFARTGLPRNALWRLVADALAGRFLEIGRQLGCLSEAKASAMAILKQPGSPLNNRQLHYFDVTVLDREQQPFTHTFRARGGCCRYYTVEGGELCPTCVLKTPTERDLELQQAMRRHLGQKSGKVS